MPVADFSNFELEPWQIRIVDQNPNCKNLLEVELIAFRHGTEHGRFYHMQRAANLLFTKAGNPEVNKPLNWNPWTERICRVLCDGDPSVGVIGTPDYIGITGPASSSKTFSVSLYVFLMWYSNPSRTKAAVSSTSIQAAKNRIWADVLQFANSVPQALRFYEILTSNPAMIKLPGHTNRESIELIAGDDAQREASEKILGIKNEWFILAVDEATEVSHALFEARNNIDKNPRFQVIFMGNAKSHDDPHGRMCEPLHGWESISVETEIWATTLPKGICIHLDGLKSPNMIVADGEEPPFPGIFARKDLSSVSLADGGLNSPGFVRFGRGFWTKSGAANQIYTQQDIDVNKAQDKPIWLEQPIRIIGHDPAFSSDGDNSPAVICDFGMTPDRIQQVAHVATEFIEVDDAQDKRRSFAMAERLREVARKYNVSVDNIGVDCTGAGVSYPDIIDEVFHGTCYRVAFNGEVSSLPYPSDGLTEPGKMFDRRVSELWYIGKLFLQRGQLKTLGATLVLEMCKCLYERGRQNKIVVETKRKMRERGVSSPDEADAFFIAIDLLRNKHGFAPHIGKDGQPSTTKGIPAFRPAEPTSFRELAKKYHPNNTVFLVNPDQPGGGWINATIKKR